MGDPNATFIYDPFQIKDERIKKEINDDAMLIALTFTDKNETGVYVITKIKAEIKKISEILPYWNFVIAGVGNYSEFKEITTLIDAVILDFQSICSPANMTAEYLLSTIVNEMKNYYRKEPKALGLELLLFTLNPDRGKIFEGYRIKGDGDYHPVTNFAIIGGYNHQKNELSESIRSVIKKELEQVYANSQPDFQTTKTLADRLINLDPIMGKLEIEKFSVPKIKTAEKKKTGKNQNKSKKPQL